jgi:hypothetical protein
MPGLFEITAAAICDEVARSQFTREAPTNTPRYRDVAAFVRPVGRMPRFLGLPIRFATLAFSGSCRPTRRRMDAWRQSPLGPGRDLIRFYRSLAAAGAVQQGRSGSEQQLGRTGAPRGSGGYRLGPGQREARRRIRRANSRPIARKVKESMLWLSKKIS